MRSFARSFTLALAVALLILGITRGRVEFVLASLIAFAVVMLVFPKPIRKGAPPAAVPERDDMPQSPEPVLRRTRCTQTGRIVTDPRAEGHDCPEHTELAKNGGRFRAEELRNAKRPGFPHGRYCCDECKWVRDPL